MCTTFVAAAIPAVNLLTDERQSPANTVDFSLNHPLYRLDNQAQRPRATNLSGDAANRRGFRINKAVDLAALEANIHVARQQPDTAPATITSRRSAVSRIERR